MADNTTLPGTGEVYASDDISGAKYQRIKLVHGVDGTNDGDVANTNPLPISLKCQAYTEDLTTTPLNNGASYTTAAFNTSCSGPGMTFLFVADQSALLEFLESHDDVTYYTADSASYPGASYVFNEMHVAHAKYWKVKITNNSGVNMTSMVMQCVQRVFGVPWKIKLDENGNAVTQGADAPWEMTGNKSNNAAVPGATNLGAVTAICQSAVPTYSDGNAVMPTTTTTGDLRITLDGETVVLGAGSQAIGKLAANSGVDIGDVDVLSLPSVTIGSLPNEGQQTMANSISVAVASDQSAIATTPAGNVAHDAGDSGNPIKIGGRADTTFQAAVADADRVDALFDVYGLLYTRKDHANRWSYHENSSSALTDASVQAAPGAGLSVYITDIIFSTGAATACNIFLEEGASTILGPYYLEAVAGRGLCIHFNQPHKCTANTAVTVTTSAAIAHGLDIKGFIAP